ncbi:hypothetical protein CANARDRAFT_175182 [[Candida] arabinofermentans NRRL YB-2248]|uniref:Uncharacterized protein n=1 Tax=[Candida] arabinofermentans NRRL YB-2248 TaxID=983967 RepID=A0A1E4T3L3_9ASCO|nr:hypothetical protein CANARDRAFT_175182 [[Candida] arabinofermentans NRRL YB-2248]
MYYQNNPAASEMMSPSMLSHIQVNYCQPKSSPQHSSPFQQSPNHQQRLMNASAASTPSRSKRRNSDSEHDWKKIKPVNSTDFDGQSIPTEQLTLENINLSEYAKFHHPDGGYIQSTPIGNIRTWMGCNNVMNRTIEKNSTFDIKNLTHGIDGYKLHLTDNGFDQETSTNTTTTSTSTSSTTAPVANSYYDGGGANVCRYGYYDDEDEFDDEDDYDMN